MGMAEERKKPKIDLKTRIPSKTVKGLTPAASAGGAIPPPPGAVPAPPPDLLGRRQAQPKIDPNDPLGAAEGAQAKQQVIVVEAAPADAHPAASKKGVFYGIVALTLVVGAGVGFLVGSGSADRGRKSKAVSEVNDLVKKIDVTSQNFESLAGLLDQAMSELNNDNLSQASIDGIKNFSSGFSAADLKNVDIAYLGEDTALKVVDYAQKVNYLDSLRANITKGNGLENVQNALKAVSIPAKQARFGVQLERPSNDMPITIADLVDFGEPLDPKAKTDLKTDPKAPKLQAKGGNLDVWPGKGDFFEKGYVSPILGADWSKMCGVRSYVFASAQSDLTNLSNNIKGSGDDKGILAQGKELADKLKALAK